MTFSKIGRLPFLPLAAALLLSPGCAPPREGAGGGQTLTLLCGAGIRPPMDGSGEGDGAGVVGGFLRENPGIRFETRFGASNLLLGQLKLTGTGDLFLPGDDFYIEEARKENLIHADRIVAWFVPVIMVARGNPLGLSRVSDLARPDARLAVADERAAAIGRITPEIFRRNGIAMEALKNIAYTGVTAPETAQAVALGHVDAAIVWGPVAALYGRDTEMIVIAPDKNVLSPVRIAVLETSRNKEAALRFLEYISGPEGREVFRTHGYLVE